MFIVLRTRRENKIAMLWRAGIPQHICNCTVKKILLKKFFQTIPHEMNNFSLTEIKLRTICSVLVWKMHLLHWTSWLVSIRCINKDQTRKNALAQSFRFLPIYKCIQIETRNYNSSSERGAPDAFSAILRKILSIATYIRRIESVVTPWAKPFESSCKTIKVNVSRADHI